MRNIPEGVILLIKSCEGYSASVYICPAGVKTFGYGSLVSNYPGLQFPINEAIAEECLRKDLLKSSMAVDRLITVPLNDNQYSALIDFTYNLGAGALQHSTLRMKLNRGEYNNAAEELLRYVYGGGRILAGLVKRRRLEYNLFCGK